MGLFYSKAFTKPSEALTKAQNSYEQFTVHVLGLTGGIMEDILISCLGIVFLGAASANPDRQNSGLPVCIILVIGFTVLKRCASRIEKWIAEKSLFDATLLAKLIADQRADKTDPKK